MKVKKTYDRVLALLNIKVKLYMLGCVNELWGMMGYVGVCFGYIGECFGMLGKKLSFLLIFLELKCGKLTRKKIDIDLTNYLYMIQ